MKAILVLDKPKNCEDCPLFRTGKDFNATINYCIPYQDKELFMVKEKGVSEKCPLKPIPYKKIHIAKYNIWKECSKEDKEIMLENKGYNKCIDEILGG